MTTTTVDSVPAGKKGRRPAEGKTKHPLLIVDDEPEVLATLRSLFRRDYHVLLASRADEALRVLEAHEVHVVITDQRMPGMTGAEFLAIVHQRYPQIVRLMITGYTDIESVIDAINRGHVYRYVSKPWDPSELESMVRQAAEQYELRAERARLVRELEEANHLKAAFISIASHELRTPLTIVLGMLDLARLKNADPALAAYLERAQQAAQRLQGLLGNTFKFLQQQDFHRSLVRTSFPVAELFADVADDLEPYVTQRQHRLLSTVEPTELIVHASRTHLRDVLDNLLTNAIKFSPDGSEIRLSAWQQGDHVRLEVVDHGVGIAWKDQPHVFEPLFSTWDTLHHSTGCYEYCKRGMGLGLAIVKKFVEMHGGTINFHSVPGKGTVFWILLPLDVGHPPPTTSGDYMI